MSAQGSRLRHSDIQTFINWTFMKKQLDLFTLRHSATLFYKPFRIKGPFSAKEIESESTLLEKEALGNHFTLCLGGPPLTPGLHAHMSAKPVEPCLSGSRTHAKRKDAANPYQDPQSDWWRPFKRARSEMNLLKCLPIWTCIYIYIYT